MTLPLPPDLLFIVFVALAFDYSNGFHDAANSIATIVSTRVLAPRYAVVWAAFFNFVAFAVFGVHVAKTIAKGSDQRADEVASLATRETPGQGRRRRLLRGWPLLSCHLPFPRGDHDLLNPHLGGNSREHQGELTANALQGW